MEPTVPCYYSRIFKEAIKYISGRGHSRHMGMAGPARSKSKTPPQGRASLPPVQPCFSRLQSVGGCAPQGNSFDRRNWEEIWSSLSLSFFVQSCLLLSYLPMISKVSLPLTRAGSRIVRVWRCVFQPYWSRALLLGS